MSASGWVHVEVEKITGETEKAFFVMIEGTRYVLPKSQIADAEDYKVGDENASMSVTEWIAKEKGLT